MKPHNLGLTSDTLSGELHFNIRQAPSEGQRALSHATALEKITAEHEIKLTEHKEKERQREAKKREQFLEKYKYIDQGHRLSQGYLDEAAGFNHAFFESQDEVRQRQQQQLLHDAFIFQEREKEKKERLQKLEQEKHARKLEKYKNVNAGYKLGSKNKETEDTRAPFSKKINDVRSGETQKIGSEQGAKRSKTIDIDLPADVLLDGESLEEALELQEQLLRQAAKVKEQISKKWPKSSSVSSRFTDALKDFEGIKPVEPEKEDREASSNHFFTNNGVNTPVKPEPSHTAAKAPITSVPTAKQSVDNCKVALGGNVFPSLKGQVEGKVLGINQTESAKAPITSVPTAKQSVDNCKVALGGNVFPSPKGQVEGKVLGINQTESAKAPVTSVPTAKQSVNNCKVAFGGNVLPSPKGQVEGKVLSINQTESAKSLPSQSTAKEVSTSSQGTEYPKDFKLVGCMLKSSSAGPVLVLRKTEEALNQALAKHIEIVDEMDKRGHSHLYKPTIEQAQYTNNRFDKKSEFDIGKVTGAIPKQRLPPKEPKSKVENLPFNKVKSEKELELEYQAEMRAARLRMQEKYERALRRPQEQV